MILPYLIGALLIGIALIVNRSKVVNYALMGAFLVLQWGITIYACFHYQETDLDYFTFDSLGLILLITLSIIAVPAVIHSWLYIERHDETPQSRGVYFAAIVGLIMAIGAGYLSNHIAVTWIFTEVTTLCASALIYHHRNKLALEGTWKYVFICAISITFIFIGILFLSLSLGKAASDDLSFKYLIAHSDKLNPFWLQLAFLFIFTGFTAKLGLVPMFTAGVDAKDKAPGPAAALLSSVLMNLGFVGIFRIYVVVANTPLHHWANLVIGIAAFLSVFVATVYMIKVKNIKRMFAYSSIEHMGLVMLGIAMGGIGYYAAILHIVLHALVKSSLFFQYNQIYRVFQSKSIYSVGNYFKYNPTGAIVLLFCFISATAMPPSGLFVSEFLIFRSMFEAHQLLLLIAILLLLTMIIWAFGKNIFKMLFIPPVGIDEREIPTINPWESTSQIVLLLGSVYLGLNPPLAFVHLIKESLMFLPQ
ncbi:complex I subunit 5 family protein [Williamwhitmania taraxaci]|uniref:Hydrogenase-4 component F n=1 Tax=Williamwhitmania taraxaci TaxID=1640674 RepID=A0A1G6MTQ0_9BACT|nr:proton-conducting transporter membrane subunit [Williamwhitmania taraxaci]SDC58375.1 hydrogenase-4 component F [Williamwhitmania taraxaci]